MNKFSFTTIAFAGIILLFTACSAQEKIDSSSKSENSVVEYSSSISSEPKQPESESSTESSKAESNSNVISTAPVPPASAESISAESAVSETVVITVEKATLQGEQTILSITDSAQQEQILAFVDSLAVSDLKTPPATGGIIYAVSITRAGSQTVEQYTFTGQKTDDDYIMAKNLENPRTWLLAVAASYDYLGALFQ